MKYAKQCQGWQIYHQLKSLWQFIHYSLADLAHIALENGNGKARKHFLSKFPGLKESTVRKKKSYKKMLEKQQKHVSLQPVTEILQKPNKIFEK